MLLHPYNRCGAADAMASSTPSLTRAFFTESGKREEQFEGILLLISVNYIVLFFHLEQFIKGGFCFHYLSSLATIIERMGKVFFFFFLYIVVNG